MYLQLIWGDGGAVQKWRPCYKRRYTNRSSNVTSEYAPACKTKNREIPIPVSETWEKCRVIDRGILGDIT